MTAGKHTTTPIQLLKISKQPAEKNNARKALNAALHKLIELLRGDIHVTDKDLARIGILLEPHEQTRYTC
jgi:hypothetical protein